MFALIRNVLISFFQ